MWRKMPYSKFFVPLFISVYERETGTAWTESFDRSRANRYAKEIADDSRREKIAFDSRKNMIMGLLAQRPYYSVPACLDLVCGTFYFVAENVSG